MPPNNSAALPATGKFWRTDQLVDLGFGSRSIRALLDSGSLVRLRYGCYLRASIWNAQSARVRSRQLIYAHAHGTRTTSTGAFAYSHTSAARLHRFYLWNVDDIVHILQRTRPSNERHGKDVQCHTRAFSDNELTVLGGLRTTSLEGTAVDCAMMLNYRQSLIVMDRFLARAARYQDLPSGAGDSRRPFGIPRRNAYTGADPPAEDQASRAAG